MARRTKPLPDFIREIGPEEFSVRYGCTLRAAKAYMNRERKPRPQSDLVTKLLVDSPVTWEGIYSS